MARQSLMKETKGHRQSYIRSAYRVLNSLSNVRNNHPYRELHPSEVMAKYSLSD